MDQQSISQRIENKVVPHSTALRLKHDSDIARLSKRNAHQLAKEVFSLYEKSQSVDVKLEVSQGTIYCHKIILSACHPRLWKLIFEIARIQVKYTSGPSETIFCIRLPALEYSITENFIRSLYTNEVDQIAGAAIRQYLEDLLSNLQHQIFVQDRRILVQKLNTKEQQKIQQIICDQLQKGEISVERGNIKEINELVIQKNLRPNLQTRKVPKCKLATDHLVNKYVSKKPNEISKPTLCCQNVNSSSVNNPITRLSKIISKLPKHNHTLACNCDHRSTQNSSLINIRYKGCEKENNSYGIHENRPQSGFGENILSKSHDSFYLKKPFNLLTTDRDSSDTKDYSLFHKVENDCMLNKQKDMIDQRSICSVSPDSSTSETSQQMDAKDSVVLTKPNESSSDLMGVKAKIKHLESIAKSNSQSSINISGSNVATFSRQLSCPPLDTQRASSSVPAKRHSFAMISQDSDSSFVDTRLGHLHESSSLEVEIATSHEGQSSPESYSCEKLDLSTDEDNDDKRPTDSMSNDGEDAKPQVDPSRPLIRARTFEIIDPSGIPQHIKVDKSGDDEQLDGSIIGSEDSLQDLHSKPLEESTASSTLKGECNKNLKDVLAQQENTEKENVQRIHVLQEMKQQDIEENPEKIREIERKKGSLIFEHNFQTFSNIPTTNMMTASIMTASMSSESSMGLGSLYSSMIENTMLSSIHSLGGCEAQGFEVCSQRPASVCLPVYHNGSDESSMLEHSQNFLHSSGNPILEHSNVSSIIHGIECNQIQNNIEKTNNVSIPHLDTAQQTLETNPLTTNLVASNALTGISMRPTLSIQKSQEEMALDLQKTISIRKRDSRSPSPDSLSVDTPVQTARRNLPSQISSFHTSSKEDLDLEEKEKDEQENVKNGTSDRKNQDEFTTFFQQSQRSLVTFNNLNTSESDNNATISDEGKSAICEENVPNDLPISKSEEKCYKRQLSTGVKDVDAIPLVCGYVMPVEETSKDKKEAENKSSIHDKEEVKQQSMFSMFIDLNSIPSPDKEAKAPNETCKSKGQGGVYMFIEADTSSPKPRRRLKSECDRNVTGSPKSSSQRDSGPTSLTNVSISSNTSQVKLESKNKTTNTKDEASDFKKSIENASTVTGKLSKIPTHSESKQTTSQFLVKKTTEELKEKLLTEVEGKCESSNIEITSEKPGILKRDSSSSLIPIRTSTTSLNTGCSELGKMADDINTKDKKGLFMFIEANSSSKGSSPKSRRRLLVNKNPEDDDIMTKSAPSDSLFNNQDSSCKLMTKSVIDREEFMAQPPTRRNVSLNDKINESSSRENFVSGIPRPIHSFRVRSPIKTCSKKSYRKNKLSSSSLRSKDDLSDSNDNTTSKDISELGTSLSVSFNEMISSTGPVPEIEDVSEVSDVSSLLSSIDRSNEPSDQDGKEQCARLGEDLLKMFLNEVNTDVTIQIGEKKIKAHKCILASRCVYFAAMLSGHWVESAGNIIKLQGFSPECVQVALHHIYSGSSTVPDNVKVGELAALADMLALDGLKDVVALHLKAKLCHYFHKPCSGCLDGVLEVLPIAGAYCLEELYHKCLRWVAKHFIVVLPTRNFSSLPVEVQDRCLKQLVDDMSISNVVDTALGCEKVISSLPVVRWAQPVFDLAAQLLESVTSFISSNMSGVLASDRFILLGKESAWGLDNLEDTMRVAVDLIRPDQAVLSHIQLTKLIDENEDDTLSEFSENFIRFLEKVLNQVEKFIIHNANRVAVCRKWPLLPPETQRRIKDAAMVILEFSRPSVQRTRIMHSANRRVRGSSSDGSSRVKIGSEHRLSRSASTSTVPGPSQRTSSARRLQPQQQQQPTQEDSSSPRCQTPPSNIRGSVQPPSATRTSTLRAQARQTAIQRSQSARTVAERSRKFVQGNDASTDEDSNPAKQQRSNSTTSFTRGATFTRSTSRAESSPSVGQARPQTPTFQTSSKPHTPAHLSQRAGQNSRRRPPPQVSHGHNTTSSTSDDEVQYRKYSLPGQTRPLSMDEGSSANKKKVSRTQSNEMQSLTPIKHCQPTSKSVRRRESVDQPRELSSPARSDSRPSTPRSINRKIENRRFSDSRNVKVTPRSARLTPPTLREPNSALVNDAMSNMDRILSNTSAQYNKASSSLVDSRSRTSSVGTKSISSSTATPPSVGSRSNTFSKDDHLKDNNNI